MIDSLKGIADLFTLVEQSGDRRVQTIVIPKIAKEVLDVPLRFSNGGNSLWGARVTWSDDNLVILASKDNGGFQTQAAWGKDTTEGEQP